MSNSQKFREKSFRSKILDNKILHEEQYITVGFADDNDLVKNRENANEHMQRMINKCNNLRAVTGRHFKEEKINFFA